MVNMEYWGGGAVVNRGLILLEVASYLLKHDVNKIGIFWPACISVCFFLGGGEEKSQKT